MRGGNQNTLLTPKRGNNFEEMFSRLLYSPEVQVLANTPQDKIHHGEGDVLTHTLMVVEEMKKNPGFLKASQKDQETLLLSALLHDTGKAFTTREEDGRLRSPGHSLAGSILARNLLWQENVPFAQREEVCHLILNHMFPFHFLDDKNAEKKVIAASLQVKNNLLAIQAESDARGRIALDQEELIEKVGLFSLFCEEREILNQAFAFANDTSKLEYFLKEDRNPYYQAYDTSDFEIVMLSGLPGCGKDTFIKNNYDQPSISLDFIREKHNLSFYKTQREVARLAQEEMKVFMRQKEDFVYNATNLHRPLRQELLGLFYNYNARVKIINLEVSPDTQKERNLGRPDAVPEEALEKMLRKWNPPSQQEAHQVIYQNND